MAQSVRATHGWPAPAGTSANRYQRQPEVHTAGSGDGRVRGGELAMYVPRHAMERHRDRLNRASEQRQASQLMALQRASRRMVRAERRLVEAQTDVLRVRDELTGVI
jgi:hypothetical protein